MTRSFARKQSAISAVFYLCFTEMHTVSAFAQKKSAGSVGSGQYVLAALCRFCSIGLSFPGRQYELFGVWILLQSNFATGSSLSLLRWRQHTKFTIHGNQARHRGFCVRGRCTSRGGQPPGVCTGGSTGNDGPSNRLDAPPLALFYVNATGICSALLVAELGENEDEQRGTSRIDAEAKGKSTLPETSLSLRERLRDQRAAMRQSG